MVSAPSNTDKSTLGHGECDGFAVHVADFGSCKPAFPDVFLRRDDTSGLTSRSSSWASAMSDADPDPRYTRGSPEKKATDSCSSGDAVTQRARCSVYYVSRFYRPPEMWCDVNSEHPSMLYGSFTDRGDMWSVGCLMAELLVIGEPLFKCDNLDSFCRIACEYLGPPGSEVLSRFRSPALRQRLLKAHVREVTQPGSTLTTGLILLSGPASGTPASGTPASGTLGARLAAICPSAADAVMQMLAWAPESRPSAAQMLRHPFFSVGGYSAQRALEAKPACEGPFDFSSYVHKTLEAVRLATLTALHESSASHERSASHPMDSVHMRALAHQVFSCLVNSTDNLKKFGAT
jgi:serine/threonine protein kinase